MTEDQVKNRLEALRWFDIYIGILKEKIVEYDKQIQIEKRRGGLYDFQEMMIEFSKGKLQQTIESKEKILRFVKLYADSEDDYKLLIMHFFERKTYMMMADELFYSERTITKKVTSAIKRVIKNAENVNPDDFPY